MLIYAAKLFDIFLLRGKIKNQKYVFGDNVVINLKIICFVEKYRISCYFIPQKKYL